MTCGADKTIVLWNPYKQLKLQEYRGTIIYTGLFYTCISQKCVRFVPGHSQEVIDADCSSDHSFLCSCSADKSVFYFDVKTAKIVRKYRAHAGIIIFACFFFCIIFRTKFSLIFDFLILLFYLLRLI